MKKTKTKTETKQTKNINFFTSEKNHTNSHFSYLLVATGTGAFLMGSTVSLVFGASPIVSSYVGGIICFSILLICSNKV